MVKIISFLGFQGGSGRTTICANIGYCLSAKYGKNVLLIDIDPNMGLTNYVLNTKSRDINKGNIESLIDPSKIIQDISNIAINAESNLDLVQSSQNLYSVQKTEFPNTMKERFKKIDIHNYDFILIDTPSTPSFYTSQAIRVSTHYFIVTNPDYNYLASLQVLLDYVNHIIKNSDNKNIYPFGLILNKTERSRKKNLISGELNNSSHLKICSEITSIFSGQIFNGFLNCAAIKKLPIIIPKKKNYYVSQSKAQKNLPLNDAVNNIVKAVL